MAKPSEDNHRGRSARRMRAMAIGALGILTGIGANTLVASAALSLLAEPVGASIRAMPQALALAQGTLVGLCGGVVAFLAVREKRTRWAGIIGLILAVSPLPLGVTLSMWVLKTRHLIILP